MWLEHVRYTSVYVLRITRYVLIQHKAQDESDDMRLRGEVLSVCMCLQGQSKHQDQEADGADSDSGH